MTTYQCGLCSHVYDPQADGAAWDQLPDDWACPVCGSSKREFRSPDSGAKSSPPQQGARKFQCGLCSHIYDEAAEPIAWDDLPDDWRCPMCYVGKSEFDLY